MSIREKSKLLNVRRRILCSNISNQKNTTLKLNSCNINLEEKQKERRPRLDDGEGEVLGDLFKRRASRWAEAELRRARWRFHLAAAGDRSAAAAACWCWGFSDWDLDVICKHPIVMHQILNPARGACRSSSSSSKKELDTVSLAGFRVSLRRGLNLNPEL